MYVAGDDDVAEPSHVTSVLFLAFLSTLIRHFSLTFLHPATSMVTVSAVLLFYPNAALTVSACGGKEVGHQNFDNGPEAHY